MRILAIPGSLRKGSYNRALLEAAKRVAPESVEVDIYGDGLSLPLFNQDSEGDSDPAPGSWSFEAGFVQPTRY